MTSVLFVRDRDFSWRAREVLREVANTPHLLLRVDVLGPHFPDRDSAPFVRLVVGRRRYAALMTEVAEDHSHLRSYFPVDQSLKGRIEFGYAGEVLGVLAIREPQIDQLDAQLIDTPFHRVTHTDLGEFARLEG